MGRTVRQLGEDGLLAALEPLLKKHTSGLPLGTGDDAAITDSGAGSGRLVWTIDSMIEGTHFRFWPAAKGAGWLGGKLAAVNLSDLAAKGAEPYYALLSLGLPGEEEEGRVLEFYAGLDAELTRVGARLLGGDTVRAPQWSLTLAMAGGLPEGLPVAARDAARPGQDLYITGHPGRSGAGLHLLEHSTVFPAVLLDAHLRPAPRLAEGRALVESFPDLAMMDVSDGVVRDAGRMAARSRARLVIEQERIPADPCLEEFAGVLGHAPRHFFLFGGEDCELLFATAAGEDAVRGAFAARAIATAVTRIGRVEPGEGVVLRIAGRDEPISPRGFEHFA